MSLFSHLDCTLDIFFVEALINGVLLAGLLALLALGLNLIFGVIDVVWICYAELVMIGMYVIFYGNKTFGLPFPARLSRSPSSSSPRPALSCTISSSGPCSTSRRSTSSS